MEQNTQKGVNNYQKWLIALNILMLILVLTLSTYIAYSKGVFDPLIKPKTKSEEITKEEDKTGKKDHTEKEQPNIKENEDKGYTEFNGRKFSTKLLKGWHIKEYIDGEDGEYRPIQLEGLTGIKIYKDNTEIAKFRAIYDIGFESCPLLGHFPDSSTEYEEKIKRDLALIEEVKIQNFNDYIDFKLLGVRMRISGNTIFFDTEPGEKYFEPQCSLGFIPLTGLPFTLKDRSESYDSFHFVINRALTNQERKELVFILENIVKK